MLLMDTNEHILMGNLTSRLPDSMTGLELEEISSRAWDFDEPNTFIDGRKPIDGVWASRCLEIGGFKLLSFGESIGDHRTKIFDVSMMSILRCCLAVGLLLAISSNTLSRRLSILFSIIRDSRSLLYLPMLVVLQLSLRQPALTIQCSNRPIRDLVDTSKIMVLWSPILSPKESNLKPHISRHRDAHTP